VNITTRNQLAEIARAVDDLGKLLTKRAADVKKHEAEKDKIQKELWSTRKEMTALQRICDDFDAVDKENQALAERQKQVKNTLQLMLKQVKSLSSEFRT